MTSVVPAAMARPAWPRLVLSDGTLEALKWFAAALMLVDHINKYLLDWSHPWMFALGRLAMPIFAVALGYNLARPGARLGRIAWKLAACAAVSTIPFIALGKIQLGGWWPLNILFTLLLAVLTLQLWERGPAGRIAAALMFLAGGCLGEFFWFGAAIVLASRAYCRTPSTIAAVVLVGAVACLGAVNQNAWALASLPLVVLATQLHLQVPRSRWAFYGFYPAHLAALWIVQRAFFA